MATTAQKPIKLEVTAPVAHITLCNPPLNVIDLEMTLELHPVLTELESRPDVSTIVFHGNARAFSAGVDIAAHAPERIHEMLAGFHAVIRAIVASRTVTIAVVRRNLRRSAIWSTPHATRLGDSLKSSWLPFRQ
jgi:enoyl-CoA hydratase/carnithine racemase